MKRTRYGQDFRYDCFLNGPWEQYAPEQYKTLIKRAFPGKKFYDPEERDPSIVDWMPVNSDAMQHSRTMVTMACPLTMSGAAQANGQYFGMHSNGLYLPLENLITIWNERLDGIENSQYGKDYASRIGRVVKTTDEAIELLKPFLRITSH